MASAAARMGDKCSDGDTIAVGSGNVFINNLPAVRLGDSTTGHNGFPPVPILKGSGSVFVNNIPAVRLGDNHAVHCKPDHGCHDGVVSVGSGNVFIG